MGGGGEREIIANYSNYVGGEFKAFHVFTIRGPPLYSQSGIDILSLSVYKRIN